MLNFYKNLWYIKGATRGDLAYMTYVKTKDGVISNMQTGYSWARNRGDAYTRDLHEIKTKGTYILNNPIKGFKVEEVAERWSTSNKLFRIRDPRGFIVEITASNMADLMSKATIKKGVIQDKLIWASHKSGKQLVVATEFTEYKTTATTKRDNASKLKVKDLKVGGMYRNKRDNCDYIYLGYKHAMVETEVYKSSSSMGGRHNPDKERVALLVSRHTTEKMHLFTTRITRYDGTQFYSSVQGYKGVPTLYSHVGVVNNIPWNELTDLYGGNNTGRDSVKYYWRRHGHTDDYANKIFYHRENKPVKFYDELDINWDKYSNKQEDAND